MVRTLTPAVVGVGLIPGRELRYACQAGQPKGEVQTVVSS